MKRQLRQKTRKELHLDFIRKTEESLTKKNFDHTNHLPVDIEVERVRDKRLLKGDLFRFRSKTYEVITANGILLDAVDIRTKEPLMVLACNVVKL